jgi:hypothetical protein
MIPNAPKVDQKGKAPGSFTQLAAEMEGKFQQLDAEVEEMQADLREADAESEDLRRRLSEGKPLQ